jgi:hypothetical protein
MAPRQSSPGALTLPPIVAAGGQGSSGVTTDVEFYDWVLGTRTTGPSLPAPREAAASAYGQGGTVYVIGGDDGQSVYNTVFA